MSTFSGDTQRQYRLTLSKGARDRFQEDTIASRLLLRAVADAAGVGSDHLDLGLAQGPGSGSNGQQAGEEAADALQVGAGSGAPGAGLGRTLWSGPSHTPSPPLPTLPLAHIYTL